MSSLAGCPGLLAASGHLEILRRCLAAIGHELVLNSLALVESAEASALHRRDMNEDVLVAGRWPNEPVAFSWIEPFDGALCIVRLLVSDASSSPNTPASLRSAPQPGVWEDPKRVRAIGTQR